MVTRSVSSIVSSTELVTEEHGITTGTDPVTGICNVHKADKLVLNLTPSTTYEWEIQVWYCDGKNTGFVPGPDFTTLAVSKRC